MNLPQVLVKNMHYHYKEFVKSKVREVFEKEGKEIEKVFKLFSIHSFYFFKENCNWMYNIAYIPHLLFINPTQNYTSYFHYFSPLIFILSFYVYCFKKDVENVTVYKQ